MIVFTCTTDTCSERFRGFTDEPTFCSICMEDLTEIDNPDGRTVEELNAIAARAPRPLPESEVAVTTAEYPLVWRVRVIRPEWFGRRCRILVHPGGRHGNRLIEFDNGDRVVCPGAYLRRAA